MLYPIHCTHNTPTSTTISPSASLTVTMTIQSQTKRTKYRPIKRPDGVIVLQRPYRPSPQPVKFEKHVRIFDGPASRASKDGKRMDESLRGVGARFGEGGRDEGSEAGNGVVGEPEEKFQFPREDAWMTKVLESLPMQRFLSEEGPWSLCVVRER
jgi:hypothetical protein